MFHCVIPLTIYNNLATGKAPIKKSRSKVEQIQVFHSFKTFPPQKRDRYINSFCNINCNKKINWGIPYFQTNKGLSKYLTWQSAAF